MISKTKEGDVMYELIQAGAHTYYMDAPTRIGFYVPDGKHAYIIDSGNSKDAAKRVRKHLDEEGWVLQGILATHAHADHIGGNRYLQQLYDCKCFARGVEAVIANDPILQPSMLYGGCPPKDLRHRFLLSDPCEAVDLSDSDYPSEITWFSLPGHSYDMVGYRTPDDVVFLGDALCSEVTLEKYGVTFLHDVGLYLQTLEQLAQMEAALFVPCHAEPTAEIAPLAQKNRERVLEIADLITSLCMEPKTHEEILQGVFTALQLRMDFPQQVLVGSTVRSYLSWLRDSGRVEPIVEQNRLLWKA